MKRTSGAQTALRILYPARAGKVLAGAARELAVGLHAMAGERVAPERSREIAPHRIVLEFGRNAGIAARAAAGTPLEGDSFAIERAGEAIILRAGSERGSLHAVYELLEELGARYPVGCAASFPRIDRTMLAAVAPRKIEPAFSRRAFVSDIMTWNYNFPDRLALHLEHDREFIPWMARRGINAFSYIRHAHDTRLRIDELAPLYREYGIAPEYGGHVLELLLPRELFGTHPEYFPRGGDEQRSARGNLCVSNADAVELVRRGALQYAHDHAENELLHIWGADVFEGAWCRCAECSTLSPQLQYMRVVNAIAQTLESDGPPVAYLAYHDTIEPDPQLRPRPNVWFEWAPRERCYSHAIDDPACETNPRYLESLKRYIELFDGRGHVFEYYADAILFGGLGFASPSVIASDLRAYRALGLRSVSCLTFGAYSALAYPVNLDAFARGTRSPDFEPDRTIADTAAERHPACAREMGDAYRAIARASGMVLGYGDVMRPYLSGAVASRKRAEIVEASIAIKEAINAAQRALGDDGDALAGAERELWEYGREALEGIAAYIGARELSGAERQTKGAAAIDSIARAIGHVRAIEPAIKGTWGAYDLEWIRELWLDGMRRQLDEAPKSSEASL